MKIIILKLFVVIAYVGMIAMNYLANSLPLNNQNTGVISDKYPSFFTPAGFTFSIWGIIYIFLGIYVFKTVLTSPEAFDSTYLVTTMILFIATSILNVLWLFCWHYDRILLSTIVMVLFLALLLIAVQILPSSEALIKSAFSLYAGWVSVALIANITIMFVQWNIPLFQNRQLLWYIIIIVIGLILVSVVLLTTHNVVYGIVFVWAYFGIFMKHVQKTGYFIDQSWPMILTGVILLLITVGTSWTFVSNQYQFFKN